MELRRVTFGKKPGRCHRLRSNGRNPPHLPVGVLGPSEPEAPHTAARPGVNTPLVISYVDNNLAGVASVGGDNRRLDETMSIVTALCWDLPEHHVVWSSATIKLRGIILDLRQRSMSIPVPKLRRTLRSLERYQEDLGPKVGPRGGCFVNSTGRRPCCWKGGSSGLSRSLTLALSAR